MAAPEQVIRTSTVKTRLATELRQNEVKIGFEEAGEQVGDMEVRLELGRLTSREMGKP